jgi:hypothetical protein
VWWSNNSGRYTEYYYSFRKGGGTSSYSEWYERTYYSEWFSMYGSLKPGKGGGGGGGASTSVGGGSRAGGSSGGGPGYSEWSEYRDGGGSWDYPVVRFSAW